MRIWPVALLGVLGWGHAAGDAALQFTIAELAGEAWRAAGITISLQRGDNGRLAATLSAARLELPAPVGVLEDVGAECRGLVVSSRRFSCDELLVAPGTAGPAIPRLAGPAEYRRDSGDVSWNLEALPPGPAKISFSGTLVAGRWTTRLVASRWPAEELAALAGRFAPDLPAISGLADLSITASGADGALLGLVFKLGGVDLALANESGTMAAEALGLELEGSAWPDGERIAFSARGVITQGEVYVEPVYANLAEHPLRIAAHGGVATGQLDLDSLVLEQAGVAHADVRAELVSGGDGWRVRNGRFRLAEATLPGAYTILLQPFLSGTVFDDLDTNGQMRGELRITDHRLDEIWLEFAGVHLDDRSARLALYDLRGELAWRSPSEGTPTGQQPVHLNWSGGFVYGIPFGAARIRLDPIDGRWSLPAVVSIPVLDGALEIEALEIGDFLAGDETISFDARLTPVSMRELSRSLDWPPLTGQVSGILPSLSYADGILAIAGEFTAEVFGGAVAIRDLRIERLLQPLARLRAEVELRGLELAEVTEALSFGLMTGRLDGHVRGLEMIDWAPVAFDARLQTPAGDRSRRRISQRAVDNIASIGGGGAGILSSGFLSFFSDFSYDAFALGCRLERDICEMSGLEARDEGYVILRGRGLPRIDVMGFSQRVNWSALVGQLAGIMEAEGVEVR